jgi:kinesin family protein 18/19
MPTPSLSELQLCALQATEWMLTGVTSRQRNDDGTIFLGDGSFASAPTPKLHQRGIRNVIKVMDERCLYVYFFLLFYSSASVYAPLG